MSNAASIETDYLARRRIRRMATTGYLIVLAVVLVVCALISEAYPSTLAAGIPRVGEYFMRLMPELHANALMGGPKVEGSVTYWFYRFDTWALLLVQTAEMAALATLGGAVVAFALCFTAARNLAPNRWIYFAFRRVLELFRTVPDIVYALILVWAFGIGPLAGIFAIGLHTVGALGKQFAEVVENAEMGPWEGVRSAGGNWLQGVRYAILPQILPNFLSYVLLRFEINVRGATVIGFVGAGGIGEELYYVISFNYYTDISAIILLIIAAVSLIDLLSEQLRSRAIGRAHA